MGGSLLLLLLRPPPAPCVRVSSAEPWEEVRQDAVGEGSLEAGKDPFGEPGGIHLPRGRYVVREGDRNRDLSRRGSLGPGFGDVRPREGVCRLLGEGGPDQGGEVLCGRDGGSRREGGPSCSCSSSDPATLGPVEDDVGGGEGGGGGAEDGAGRSPVAVAAAAPVASPAGEAGGALPPVAAGIGVARGRVGGGGRGGVGSGGEGGGGGGGGGRRGGIGGAVGDGISHPFAVLVVVSPGAVIGFGVGVGVGVGGIVGGGGRGEVRQRQGGPGGSLRRGRVVLRMVGGVGIVVGIGVGFLEALPGVLLQRVFGEGVFDFDFDFGLGLDFDFGFNFDFGLLLPKQRGGRQAEAEVEQVVGPHLLLPGAGHLAQLLSGRQEEGRGSPVGRGGSGRDGGQGGRRGQAGRPPVPPRLLMLLLPALLDGHVGGIPSLLFWREEGAGCEVRGARCGLGGAMGRGGEKGRLFGLKN